MQVLPRVFSTAADGSGEREFLMDFFTDAHDMLSKLFLKGYQWPFDVRKVADGSSIIDILVYLETCKGRKVYLDYRTNPAGGEFSYDALLPEAREYLTRPPYTKTAPRPHDFCGQGAALQRASDIFSDFRSFINSL